MESLTWEEFHAAASKLTALPDSNGPWLLVQEPKGDNYLTDNPGSGYLKTERFAKASDLGRCNKTVSETLSSSKVIRCEYHVVYSLSYSVPVLYFNFILPDGSLMKLEDVWSIFRRRDDQEGEESDPEWIWNAVSQQDHPLLHVPFFWIHPCHTKTFMKHLSETCPNPALSYLITWLSIVATKVGLEIPLQWSHYVAQQHLQHPDDED